MSLQMDDLTQRLVGEVIALRLSLRTVTMMFAVATEGAETVRNLHAATNRVLDNMKLDLAGFDEDLVRAHAQVMVDQVYDPGNFFDLIRRKTSQATGG